MKNFTLKVTTPWGPMSLVGNSEGLLQVDWASHKSDKDVPPWAVKAKQYIESLFNEDSSQWSDFEIPVIIKSEFDKKVYKQLVRTSIGETLSYQQLASKVGNKNASRAVGSSMRRNPLPLLIPCHRVIKSDGKLGNYSAPGGISKKQEILSFERHKVAKRAPKHLMGPRIKFVTET
jgi:methylated-DNA-[protein]-cysteine S-methyltransferase